MEATPYLMTHAILSLNYVAVLAAAVAGFLLGWLWYSVLFGKIWMAEMNITPEKMKAAAEKGMAKFFLKGFVLTFLGTFGLAALLAANRTMGWQKGALFGGFVGVCVVGARMLNSGVWEQRSLRLLAINVGHEVALFTMQGAIFGVWR
jgi:hypothetical protein